MDNKIEVSKKELDMSLALINQYAVPLDLSKYKDEYHTELLKLIEAKAKGKRPTIRPPFLPVNYSLTDHTNHHSWRLSVSVSLIMIIEIKTHLNKNYIFIHNCNPMLIQPYRT